jgi:1-acyl-sn-glycerol-3-phosphate acyltransferase
MTSKELTPTTALSTIQPQSQFVPWLKNIVYPLANYLLLPTYFSSIEISGRENLPTSGAVILAPTHRSRWDSQIIPYAVGPYVTGRNVHFMVSANEVKGLQGWFIRRLGGFEIDTDKPALSTIRYTIDLLHRGEMLAIFPEGNLFYDDTVHPIKQGLARMAMQAISSAPDLELSIVPIGTKYIQPVPRFGDRVKIDIGKPIDVRNYGNLSTKVGTQKITQILTASLLESTAKLSAL